MNLPASIKTFLDQTAAWTEPSTVSSYKEKLSRFATFAESKEITTGLILDYKATLFRSGMRESSIAGYFSTLSLFLSWCVKTGLITENPMPERMKFTVGRTDRVAFTEPEYLKMLRTAEDVREYDYWPDAMRLAWNTGLRLSDVALLKRSSLDVQQNSLRLIPKKTKRFVRIVEIPLPEGLVTTLLGRFQPGHSEYVFPEMQRLYAKDRHKTLSNQFGYIGRRAGIKKGFHSLRRSAITRWLNEGVSPALVSNMTGINIAQIMSYFTPQLETKRAALGLAKKKETAA